MQQMSELRLRVLWHVLSLHECAATGEQLRRGRLLDVGYGNGSFIRAAAAVGWAAVGNDVNPTEYPGVRRVALPTDPLPPEERYRVITFFDSLEHFEDLAAPRAAALSTDWLMISVPRAPRSFPSRPWKHFRPGEHHHYWWNPRSFELIFTTPEVQARLVYAEHPEDHIRGTLPDGVPNIMTCVLRLERL
jgi:hypothetical protein